ncbi:hypothetical protein D9615_010196 [Tricholomella constricta]|uniref:Uncharacterized protein n=1 Tax=Tricholomella constricta TaxID=117010 RepID=A0A8H5GN51_9AGAR|nr:hypothetical protein D9615_010196 [Tricholomella constricta]
MIQQAARASAPQNTEHGDKRNTQAGPGPANANVIHQPTSPVTATEITNLPNKRHAKVPPDRGWLGGGSGDRSPQTVDRDGVAVRKSQLVGDASADPHLNPNSNSRSAPALPTQPEPEPSHHDRQTDVRTELGPHIPGTGVAGAMCTSSDADVDVVDNVDDKAMARRGETMHPHPHPGDANSSLESRAELGLDQDHNNEGRDDWGKASKTRGGHETEGNTKIKSSKTEEPELNGRKERRKEDAAKERDVEPYVDGQRGRVGVG